MKRLSALLTAHGFVPEKGRVKLVRYKDARFDIEKLRRQGWFETYQQYQRLSVFDRCAQIIAFVGEPRLKARFVGVYDVGARRSGAEVPIPSDCPYPELAGDIYYPLKKRPGFDDLEDALVIDWGDAPRSWHQWFTDRTDRMVVEMRPTREAG